MPNPKWSRDCVGLAGVPKRTLSGRDVGYTWPGRRCGIFGTEHKNSVHCCQGEKWTVHLFQSWPASLNLVKQDILLFFALKPENNLLLLQLLLPVSSKWAWSSQVISCFALGREWSWEQGSDQLCSLDSCRQQEITYYTVSIIRGEKGSWEKWASAQSSCNCSWWDLISRLIHLDCAPGTGTWEVRCQHSLGELTHEETSLQEPCVTMFPPGIRSC